MERGTQASPAMSIKADGPAAPLVLSAADLIVPASTLSNSTGWTGGGSPTPIRAEGWMG